MKPPLSTPLATWMLEHLTPKPHNDALSGDLLEELHSGRSTSWYWRQVTSAIGVSLFHRSRDYASPLIFSACWSIFYPAWLLSIWRSQFSQTIFDRWSALGWPYSASLEVGRGTLPAFTFISFGFFVYLVLRARTIAPPSGLRILGGLSLSLNVFLVSTIGLSHYLGSGTYLGRENFYLSPYHLAICIPSALSLFSATLTAFPPQRKRQSTTSFTAPPSL